MQLPTLLKQKLVEDWQRAERGEELALPRKPSISDILQQYVDSTRGARDSVEAEEEIANGLRIYFDKALQQLLLYATEQDLAAKVNPALCTSASRNCLAETLCSRCCMQRGEAVHVVLACRLSPQHTIVHQHAPINFQILGFVWPVMISMWRSIKQVIDNNVRPAPHAPSHDPCLLGGAGSL